MKGRGKKGFDFQAWAKNQVISSASNMDRGRGRPSMPFRGRASRHRGVFSPSMSARPSNSYDNNYFLEQLNGQQIPDIPGHLSIDQKRIRQQQLEERNYVKRAPDSWQRRDNGPENFYPNYDNTGRVEPNSENNGGWYPNGPHGFGNAEQQCHQNFSNFNNSNRGGYNQGKINIMLCLKKIIYTSRDC